MLKQETDVCVCVHFSQYFNQKFNRAYNIYPEIYFVAKEKLINVKN